MTRTLEEQIARAREYTLPQLGAFTARATEYANALNDMDDATRKLASFLFTLERFPDKPPSTELEVQAIPPLHLVLAVNINNNWSAATTLVALIEEAA